MSLCQQHKKTVGEADLLMLNAEDHTYAKIMLTDEDGLQAQLQEYPLLNHLFLAVLSGGLSGKACAMPDFPLPLS